MESLCICNDILKLCRVIAIIGNSSVVVLGVYRPPSGDIESFIVALEEKRGKTVAPRKNCCHCRHRTIE